MSVTLWLDTAAEKTVELGPTFPAYQAFAEMAHAAGSAWGKDYASLSGVLSQCEDQTDADTAWLADVRRQAADFLAKLPKGLSDTARDILEQLARLPAPAPREKRPERFAEPKPAPPPAVNVTIDTAPIAAALERIAQAQSDQAARQQKSLEALVRSVLERQAQPAVPVSEAKEEAAPEKPAPTSATIRHSDGTTSTVTLG